MSLVGPRPPLPEEVALYQDDVRRRLLVKPGLTGLWQISGRSDLAWDDSVRLDLRYVENWSFTLDLMILWKTMSAVVRRPRRVLTACGRRRRGRCRLDDAGRPRPSGITHVHGGHEDGGEHARNNPVIGEVDLHVDDALLAEELAERAGALLLQLRAGRGADGKTGDAGRTRSCWPSWPPRRARRRGAVRGGPGRRPPGSTAERVWIVDPLDGTREFGEAGRDRLGRARRAVGATASWPAGAVALPARGAVPRHRTPAAAAGPATRPAARSVRIAVSRTRPPAWSHAAGRASSAPSWCRWARPARRSTAVLRGEVDAYVHAGGQYEWDSAAPVAVAPAAGLHASRDRRVAAASTTSPTRGCPTCWSADAEVADTGAGG